MDVHVYMYVYIYIYIYIYIQYSFLNIDDLTHKLNQNLYCKQLDNTFNRLKVSHEKNSQILSLVEIKKEKTNRRLIESKRNIKKLFYSRQKTLLQCSLFSKVLAIMKRYVFLFQQNETVIFRLFLEQLLLFREFVLYFV